MGEGRRVLHKDRCPEPHRAVQWPHAPAHPPPRSQCPPETVHAGENNRSSSLWKACISSGGVATDFPNCRRRSRLIVTVRPSTIGGFMMDRVEAGFMMVTFTSFLVLIGALTAL